MYCLTSGVVVLLFSYRGSVLPHLWYWAWYIIAQCIVYSYIAPVYTLLYRLIYFGKGGGVYCLLWSCKMYYSIRTQVLLCLTYFMGFINLPFCSCLLPHFVQRLYIASPFFMGVRILPPLELCIAPFRTAFVYCFLWNCLLLHSSWLPADLSAKPCQRPSWSQ